MFKNTYKCNQMDHQLYTPTLSIIPGAVNTSSPLASVDGSVVATTRGGAATVAKAGLYDKAFIGAAARDVSLLNDR